MIEHLTSPQLAQAWCQTARQAGKTIGFVPTMGTLHEGHLSLVNRARDENEAVVVSIFVNPLQFNNPDDLEKYPRNETADIDKLAQAGVDMVFTGSANAFLGDRVTMNAEQLTDPGPFALGMEGTQRPGHFAGVREIVSRLFAFVGPCRAYFGEKDYQQLQVIRDLAKASGDIEIVACATSRESSGLARSSRNQRLTSRGRQAATVIYRAMQAANTAWQQGSRSPADLQAAMLDVLENSEDLDLEYAEVRDPLAWSAHQPDHDLKQARVFVAGQIEGVRLIDNMALGQ